MSEHFGQTLRDSIKPRNLCIGCVYARPRWVKRLSALPCQVSRFIRCIGKSGADHPRALASRNNVERARTEAHPY
jgi:hypothetical protein